MGVVANRELTDDVVRRFSQSEQVGEVPPARESGVRLRGGAAPERVERIEGSGEVTFVHDYGSERLDLRSLYEKAKDAQWNGRTLAWDTPVDPEAENFSNSFIPIFGTPVWDKLDKKRDLPQLRRHTSAYLLSNFLHGEQGALLATAQLACAVPNAEAKLYAATQAMDEARHAEVYARYLREKIELTYPISPHLKQLLDAILRESRWDMKFLGMQIMVEGLALAAFGVISQTANEPLIREIVRLIMLDESRHVAFGVLSLKGAYEDMTASELAEREEFILGASRLMRDRFLMQEVWENLGLPTAECLDAVHKSPIMQTFQSLLFSKIVPNVKKLGLLTPRVRKGFEELRVIQYETWDASA
ncbi:MAG: ferritin-like domain-containing protein [Polyangiaceae bacterium]|nr:ferritin-like domain-containing protein [Polyangiaceae bacterium]MBK8938317.1 ferritin-like domain-containing protein [Polyangiaceae bacterium]